MATTLSPFQNEQYTINDHHSSAENEDPSFPDEDALDITWTNEDQGDLMDLQERKGKDTGLRAFWKRFVRPMSGKSKVKEEKGRARRTQPIQRKPSLWSHPGIPVLAQPTNLNLSKRLSISQNEDGKVLFIPSTDMDKSLRVNRLPQTYYLGFCDGREVPEPEEMKVVGEVPNWMKGVFY
ncbi:hypothetical protein HMI55_005147, partial [Coelomomyces lativittatus]